MGGGRRDHIQRNQRIAKGHSQVKHYHGHHHHDEAAEGGVEVHYAE